MRWANIEWAEEISLPWWVQMQPKRWQKKWIAKKYPYVIQETEKAVFVKIHTTKEEITEEVWKNNMEDLFWELRRMGVGIVVAPKEIQEMEKRLPFADGKRLCGLFAFSLGRDELKRSGVCLDVAKYLVVGETHLEMVLAGIGNQVNYLAYWGRDLEWVEQLEEWILVEYGLQIAKTTSLQSHLIQEADVLILCDTSSMRWEYIVSERTKRIDVFDEKLCGIWFGKCYPLAGWEAMAYCNVVEVQKLWKRDVDWMDMVAAYEKLHGMSCGVTTIL